MHAYDRLHQIAAILEAVECRRTGGTAEVVYYLMSESELREARSLTRFRLTASLSALGDLPKSKADELMRYPNTWIAGLFGVTTTSVRSWRRRFGYSASTWRGGARIEGRKEFEAWWEGLRG